MVKTAETFIVDVEPVGRRTEAHEGDTLLAATQAAGVGLTALCGGIGACDTCRVRLVAGKLSRPTLVEEGIFSDDELRAGWRLACQAEPLSDVKIDIPAESLTAPQRLQIEGESESIALDPVITVVDLHLSVPTAHDLRADETRINDGLRALGHTPVAISVPMLGYAAEQLRARGWSARLAIRDGSALVGLLNGDHPPLGLAVDIGTTSLAAYLVDLATGGILAKTGAMNPQIAYGEDVISRIMYIDQHPGDRPGLQRRVVAGLNELVHMLCAEVGAVPEEIVDAVLVGNTAMHHIVSGLPVQQLGEAPYVPAASGALEFPAHSIGLTLSPGAIVYMPPNIAGYVGADHVAVLLATGLWNTTGTKLAID
ncbi:MAG TPA: 2Fe-2S iron-sulfur cluster-binding protein, partial [Aggregatilineales bacterium]|nr:2Fe-2S iron-sulfur cluster-binding protein [Aggregatilineales bacterium]